MVKPATQASAMNQLCTTRKSNFDLTGAKLVKRGSIVSHGGLRYLVISVRMGIFYGRVTNSTMAISDARVLCSSVQVVAS